MLKEQESVIGIIDSGIGGVSILNQLIELNKTGNYVYFADNKYMPYGNKTKLFILSLFYFFFKVSSLPRSLNLRG